VAEKIDEETRKIVEQSYNLAKRLLNAYRDRLDAVANKLLEVETITREEFEALFPPPTPKKSGTPQPALALNGAPAD
jgi:cell division protease FtsH